MMIIWSLSASLAHFSACEYAKNGEAYVQIVRGARRLCKTKLSDDLLEIKRNTWNQQRKKKSSEKNNNKTDKRERQYEASDLKMNRQHHSMAEVEFGVERGENRPKAAW